MQESRVEQGIWEKAAAIIQVKNRASLAWAGTCEGARGCHVVRVGFAEGLDVGCVSIYCTAAFVRTRPDPERRISRVPSRNGGGE